MKLGRYLDILVLDQREKYESARLAYYKTMNEYSLRRYISVQRNLHQRTDGSAPAHLDPEVLFMFRALFEKSASPQNYLWQLGQLYAATRDFRLLESLPRAVIGQTANKIYGFLNSVSTVTSQVQDEATVDSIVEHLDKVRAEAIRSLEPTGLLHAAEAQIHQKRWDDAKETLDRLDKTNWPGRFGNVRAQASSLRGRIAREKR